MSNIHRIEAAHVLHWFRPGEPGGMFGGGFTNALIEAISRADDMNRQRLARGFAGYVAAVDMIQRQQGGVEMLRRISLDKGEAEGEGA